MLFFSFLKGFRKEAVLAPLFKLLEAVFELVVPLLVASLIDEGIAAGDRDHVIRMILLMLLFASYTPIKLFGVLMSLALTAAMLATLCMLPPTLILVDKIHNRFSHK